MPSERIATSSAPGAIGPYSQGVVAGGFVFVSGQLPLDPATSTLVAGDIRVQTRQVLANLAAILAARGLSLHHVVKTEVFLADLKDFAGMNEVYALSFVGPVQPARVTIQAARLPKDALIEISCIAAAG